MLLIQTARVGTDKGALGLFALVKVPVITAARLGDGAVVVVFMESVQVAIGVVRPLIVIVEVFTGLNLFSMAARSAT